LPIPFAAERQHLAFELIEAATIENAIFGAHDLAARGTDLLDADHVVLTQARLVEAVGHLLITSVAIAASKSTSTQTSSQENSSAA
jgi:hypothetical protein